MNTVVLTYDILEEIASVHQDLGLTIREIVRGATTMSFATGAGAAIGGLLGGPAGLIAGGAIGSAVGGGAAAATMKKFKPLSTLLRELTSAEKARLMEVARRAFRNLGVNVACDIVGNRAGELARNFIRSVYEEFSGTALDR